MNNLLAILEFCAFYIEYKDGKLTGINCRGRTNVKYLMSAQLLPFCKNTANASSLSLLKIITKSTHFLPAKKMTPILWTELQTNKIQKVSKPYI